MDDVPTESVPTETAPTETVPRVITIDELTQIYGAKVQKESQDRDALLSILNTTPDLLRPKLYTWALNGFTSAFELFRYQVELPAACSDGQSRELMPYIEFLIGAPLYDKISQLQSLLVGIQLNFIISDRNIIILSVSRV